MAWVPKFEERHYFCHHCKNEIDFQGIKMQRSDTCPHCSVDMHCCKNCEYWDPSAHNQCREKITELVRDREASNFCSFFTFRDGKPEDLTLRQESSKNKLSHLFSKDPELNPLPKEINPLDQPNANVETKINPLDAIFGKK